MCIYMLKHTHTHTHGGQHYYYYYNYYIYFIYEQIIIYIYIYKHTTTTNNNNKYILLLCHIFLHMQHMKPGKKWDITQNESTFLSWQNESIAYLKKMLYIKTHVLL